MPINASARCKKGLSNSKTHVLLSIESNLLLYLLLEESKMENLLLEFQAALTQVPIDHKRYLFNSIDLSNRLIAIKGARGAGKSTLLLQLAKLKLPTESSLYVSLEHIYFYENNLYELAASFEKFGGIYLLLDEVHKYPNWSREIKLIYDNFPKLNILFTSSSILELTKSEADLSRRMVSYNLNELSFREFINFETPHEFGALNLSTILEKHNEFAQKVLQQLKPLPLFAKYLKTGAYPYYLESESTYLQKLLSTINLVIETDINAVENMNYESLINLKKLLKAIATSAPFTPNISKLASLLAMSRNQLVHSIKLLDRAGLVHSLYKNQTGIGVLTKPEKIYLNNTNLMFALDESMVNKGNLRETFFVNQLMGVHSIELGGQADFLINRKYHIEVGGKNKTKKQLKGLEPAFVVKDDIEVGIKNSIPLWLFGFLY